MRRKAWARCFSTIVPFAPAQLQFGQSRPYRSTSFRSTVLAYPVASTILPLERAAHEFRWNQIEISQQRYEWEARHWFSSGFDEPAVQEKRAKVCRTAWDQPQAGSLNWLRQLHASHSPAPGPFSICMHREDAATVSYTEVVVGNRTILMKYHHGPLCNSSTEFVERIIPL